MNKLGFYLELTDDANGLWDAIRRAQPPVLLFHRNALNRLLLRQIREFRAPNAFVIGRVYLDPVVQERQLTEGDPAENGRSLAADILNHDFAVAKETAGNPKRLLIDAWMSLNECIPGPLSRAYRDGLPEERAQIEQRWRAYDQFQVAFRDRLMEQDIEAVAFNFGAGNFGTPAHYLDAFPHTLRTYNYLGFHEYGWPALSTALNLDAASSAGTYRDIVTGLTQATGRSYKVIITEAGLARMYRHPHDAAGDVGWLYEQDPISQEDYWRSLAWYNDFMSQDDNVVGACLYQVGHAGRWYTFRHLGQDHQGQALRIVDRIVALNRPGAELPALAAAPAHPKIMVRGRVTLQDEARVGATVRLVGTRQRLSRLRRASPIDPEGSSYAMVATTGEQGDFRFRAVPPGDYTLEVSAPGAKPFTTTFSAMTSLRIAVALTLAPADWIAAAAPGPFRRLECGINIDPANSAGNPSGAAVRELGANWVRFVFQNRPGQSLSDSFTQYDRVVEDMRQAAVNVLLILNNQSLPGKPPRAALDDREQWRNYIGAFAERCREVAEHYHDSVPAYQIWNEPDHDGHPGYDPTIHPRLYGEMLRAAYQSIRKVSQSLIVSAGMASGNPGWVKDAMAATDKKLFADVLAVHPYGRRPRFHWPTPNWGGLQGPEMIELLKSYRAVAAKPVWVTEFGTEDQHTIVVGPSGAPVPAGDLFPAITLESVGDSPHNPVTKFFWFCWSDGMVAGMGLLDAGGTRKASFDSYRSYAARPVA